jgi:hypothetical protein
MILYVLVALSIGIEGGYDNPAVGFNNIDKGAGFALVAAHNIGFADMTLSLRTVFYTGDNPVYSMNTVGIRMGMYKKNWPVSPVLAAGSDYVIRDLDEANENGFAGAYSIGVLLNFKVEKLHVYPMVSYDGLTDLQEHAGFIGLRLGILYEI